MQLLFLQFCCCIIPEGIYLKRVITCHRIRIWHWSYFGVVLFIYIYTCTFLSFQDVDSLYFKTSLIKLIIFSVDMNSWRSLGYHNNFSNNVYYSFQRHTLDTGCNSKTKFCKKSFLTFFKITLPVQFSGKNTRI